MVLARIIRRAIAAIQQDEVEPPGGECLPRLATIRVHSSLAVAGPVRGCRGCFPSAITRWPVRSVGAGATGCGRPI
jgi:hypothetical protein